MESKTFFAFFGSWSWSWDLVLGYEPTPSDKTEGEGKLICGTEKKLDHSCTRDLSPWTIDGEKRYGNSMFLVIWEGMGVCGASLGKDRVFCFHNLLQS